MQGLFYKSKSPDRYFTRRDFLKTSSLLIAGASVFGSTIFADATKGIIMQKLNNGIYMPIIGLGTYELTGKNAQTAILDAISVGYLAFDSAQMYNNEKDIGIALKQSRISRHQLFITTKLSSNMNHKETALSIESSLNNLGGDYIDLLLLHRAYPNAKEMYKVMEEFHTMGKIRAIGISNFDTKVYLDFIKTCKIIPAINQVQVHAFFQREELQKVMLQYGTIMQAWSPFAKGENDFFNNAVLQNIARQYGKTTAQVGLRYLIERGINVIPKTSKKQRMIENIDIFDFALSADDMQRIKKLDTNKSSFGWDV